jgi:hypothetical protein
LGERALVKYFAPDGTLITCPLSSIDPGAIVGKVLKKVRRSSTHPVLTLDFADNTTFQILVDGYDPIHKGVPKELEMDPVLDSIFANDSTVDLPIVDCALITLSDKAFQRKQNDRSPIAASPSGAGLHQWDQNHLGVAFKFAGDPKWHCVWACMQEYDEGSCVFRSYDDVYLDKLQRSPRKSVKTHTRKRSMAA